MKKMQLCLLIALLATAGCQSNGAKGKLSAAAERAKVDTDNTSELESFKDVYIGNFSVVFYQRASASSTAKDTRLFRAEKGSSQAILSTYLRGVPDSTFQSITDQAYQDFVQDLQSKGYRVKDQSELKQNPYYAADKAKTLPYRENGLFGNKDKGESKYLIFAPQGMDLFFGADDFLGYGPLNKLAEMSKTPVLYVRYYVHYAYFDKEADHSINYVESVPLGGTTPQKSNTFTASVSLGQGIQVTPGSEMYFALDTGGSFSDNGYVKMKDPAVALGAYGQSEDITSGGTKFVNGLSSVLSVLGSSKSRKSQTVAINAVPEYYEYGAVTVLKDANKRLVGALPTPK